MYVNTLPAAGAGAVGIVIWQYGIGTMWIASLIVAAVLCGSVAVYRKAKGVF